MTHRPAWVLACLAIGLVAATGARADQLDTADGWRWRHLGAASKRAADRILPLWFVAPDQALIGSRGMALRARSKALFVVAALLLAGAAACGFLWRDQQANAEQSARLARTEGIDTSYSLPRFEKSAGEWRLLTFVGLALGGAAVAGGLVKRRG